MHITKRSVEALKPPAEGSQLHWDDALPGFGVRTWASGTKTFILQRRIKGRDRRLTLGRFGPVTVEQARREAKRLIGEIVTGHDPVAERKREEAQRVTLAQAYRDYLNRRTLKAITRADMDNALGAFQDWMPRPVTGITPEMVTRRHKLLGEKSPARANLAMRYLRAVLNFAAAEYAAPDGTPILTYNPVTRLSQTRGWFRVGRRQTVIKAHQLQPWMQAVVSLDNPVARDYLLLVLMTGLRRSEALALTWERIDLEARTLTVTDTKAHRVHTLPLSDYLVTLLTRRQDAKVNEYVFADQLGRPLGNLRYVQGKIEKTSGVTFCIHDLRRTFATVAESLDIPGYALKRLLNHATGADVTAGYLIVDVERLRAPMQRITDYLLKAGGVAESAPVIELVDRQTK